MIWIINKEKTILVGLLLLTFSWAQAFDGPGGKKGIGPINEVKLEALQEKMAETGLGIFTTKCAPCHKMGEKVVGPALGGITKRRTPEWIMNMMLNSDEMLKKDADAKELFESLLIAMPNQQLSEPDARAVLEYFRYFEDKGKDPSKSASGSAKDEAKTTKGKKATKDKK